MNSYLDCSSITSSISSSTTSLTSSSTTSLTTSSTTSLTTSSTASSTNRTYLYTVRIVELTVPIYTLLE